MRWSVKKLLLITLLLLQSAAYSQHEKASPAFHDSLRTALKDFYQNSNDGEIKLAIEQTLSLYTTDTIGNELASQLEQTALAIVLRHHKLQVVPPFLFSKYCGLFQHLFILLKPRAENLLFAHILDIQGYWYHESEKNDTALILFQKSLDIKKKLSTIPQTEVANSLMNIAAICGRLDSSIIFYRQAETFIKKNNSEENTQYLDCLLSLADQYREIHVFDTAVSLLEKMLSISKKMMGEESTDYAYQMILVADLYTYIPLYKKALDLSLQALDITQKKMGEENLQYIFCLNMVGEIYYSRGEYEKALYPFQHTLEIKKKIFGNGYFNNVVSLHNLATLYMRMGLYENALPLLKESLAISGKIFGTNSNIYAFDLPQLANVYQALGQFEKALPLYQQTIDIYKHTLGGTNGLFYPRELNSLANLYEAIGQTGKAYSLMQEALARKKNIFGEHHPEYAKTLITLAEIYKSNGQFSDAVVLLQQASAIYKKVFGKAHPDYANAIYNQASLYRRMGQFKKAVALQEESLAIKEKVLSDEHPDVAASLNDLGLLYMDMGQYDKAGSLFQQALKIREKNFGLHHPSCAETLTNLGLLDFIIGNYKNASNAFINANTIELENLSSTYSSLSEKEKMVFVNDKPNLFSYLPSLLLKNNSIATAAQQAYNNELVLKGMILEDQLQVLAKIRNSGDSNAIRLYGQWRFYKAFYSSQLLLPVKERVNNIDSLQEIITLLEQQLSTRSADFSNSQKNNFLSAADIAGRLHKDEAAIEFVRFNVAGKKKSDKIMYAALILLPGNTMPAFVPLCEEKKLSHFLKFSNNSVSAIRALYPGTIISGKGNPSTDSLYKLIWQPFEKYLFHTSTIYYAPTGLLNRISFQALRTSARQMLIDKFHLHQLLSTRSIRFPDTSTKKILSISSWGNIDYDSAYSDKPDSTGSISVNSVNFFDMYITQTRQQQNGAWQPLPGTHHEIDSLASVFRSRYVNNQIFTGSRASEESFKTLDGRSPQILHIATHGFFLPPPENKLLKKEGTNQSSNAFKLQPNPMFRSGLVFAGANLAWNGKSVQGEEDGILTAYEIAQMDLSHTNLVVLSACETALGDIEGNEGVIGLQRAFRIAGVKQMVMSLWQVPDKETIELMILFYQNLLNNQSAADALRNAQLKMKEKYSPFFWAGFILIE